MIAVNFAPDQNATQTQRNFLVATMGVGRAREVDRELGPPDFRSLHRREAPSQSEGPVDITNMPRRTAHPRSRTAPPLDHLTLLR